MSDTAPQTGGGGKEVAFDAVFPAAEEAPMDAAPAAGVETLVQEASFADAVRAVMALNQTHFDGQAHSLADDIVLDRIEEQARVAGGIPPSESVESLSLSEMREHSPAVGPDAAARTERGGGSGLEDLADDAESETALGKLLHTASSALGSFLRLLLSELSLLVILVPSALAFLSHPEEPLRLHWQVRARALVQLVSVSAAARATC